MEQNVFEKQVLANAKKSKGKRVFFWIAAVCIISIVFSLAQKSGSDKTKKPEPVVVEVKMPTTNAEYAAANDSIKKVSLLELAEISNTQMFAEGLVSQQLLSPNSASFSDDEIFPLDLDSMKVVYRGHVTYENAFGVELPATYYVKAQLSFDKGMTAYDVKLIEGTH